MIETKDLADAVERATGISVYPNPPQIKQWVNVLSKMSKTFTLTGGNKDTYKEAQAIDAYCMYFFPSNVARFCNLFEQVNDENPKLLEDILKKDQIVFWDIGCGPATASFAFAQTFTEAASKTNFILVDANQDMLGKANKIMFGKKTNSYNKIFASDIEDLISRHGKPDIICMANVLTEVKSPDIFAYLKTEAPVIFIMEPAAVKDSRNLLTIRDQILESQDHPYKVLYPCTIQEECPALKDPKNWCHMSSKWLRPEWIRLLDKHLMFNKSELDYTPIVLSPSVPQTPEQQAQGRVVSDLSKKKWGNEFFVCDTKGVNMVCKKGLKVHRGDKGIF